MVPGVGQLAAAAGAVPPLAPAAPAALQAAAGSSRSPAIHSSQRGDRTSNIATSFLAELTECGSLVITAWGTACSGPRSAAVGRLACEDLSSRPASGARGCARKPADAALFSGWNTASGGILRAVHRVKRNASQHGAASGRTRIGRAGGRGSGWNELQGDRGGAIGQDVDGGLAGSETGPGCRDLVLAGGDGGDVERAVAVGLSCRRAPQASHRRLAPCENDVGAGDGQTGAARGDGAVHGAAWQRDGERLIAGELDGAMVEQPDREIDNHQL